MPLITADNLSKAFGTRTLFSGVSFSAEEGENVGFVGPNGSGKSTLFKILAGIEPLDQGRVAVRRDASIGYLSQEPEFQEGATIWSAAALGNAENQKLLADFQKISTQMESATGAGSDQLIKRQAEVSASIDRLGAWDWQHELEAVLTTLQVLDWERPVDRLSGGERKRVALARALISRPDLLLLDEPTNHLDADTTLWLEDYLLEYPGTVLLITHDRYFLDRVVDRIVEVHPDRFASFDGGYTEYLEARAERAERLSVEAEKRERMVEKELAWLRRSPAARTGKQKARIKRADGLASMPNKGPEKEVRIEFAPPPRLGRTVLDVKDISKAFGESVIFDGFSTQLRSGERVGIIGPNGAGKTTLLRTLIGEIAPDSGEVITGKNTSVAYFDQTRMDLDPGMSVYESMGDTDWLELGGEKIHARSYLERFLFPTSTHQLRVGSLSGGERNRLLLARLMLNSANLLVLDEPTNDLDLDTLRILENALVDFGGTALVVTHDRYFLDRVATSLLVFEGGGHIHRHEGGYDLYQKHRAAELAAEKAWAAQKKSAEKAAAPKASSSDKPRKLSYREQRELESMEAAIVDAEARRDDLAAALAKPELYTETPEKVGAIRTEFERAEEAVRQLYGRWEELESIASG